MPPTDAAPARFAASFCQPERNQAALLAALEQFCRQRTLSLPLRYRLGLIVDELVTNAIVHGGCTGEHQTLSVIVLDHPATLQIEITDTGTPFDPTVHPLLPYPEEGADVPVGGVGLRMVRRFAERLQYTRQHDGNHLFISLNKTEPEDVCCLKK